MSPPAARRQPQALRAKPGCQPGRSAPPTRPPNGACAPPRPAPMARLRRVVAGGPPNGGRLARQRAPTNVRSTPRGRASHPPGDHQTVCRPRRPGPRGTGVRKHSARGVRAGRCRRRARVCASRAVRCGVVVCDRRPRAWSDRSAGGSLPDRPRGRRRALPRRARCAGGRARPPDARQQLNELQFGRQLRATNVTRQHRHTERIRLPREQP